MRLDGIVYLAWGEKDIQFAEESSASVKALGYNTCLVTPDAYSSKEFNLIIRKDLDISSGLARKALMYDVAPFDTNLFLDNDTLAFDDLEFGFRQADRWHICVCIAPSPCLSYSWRIHAKEEGMSLDYIQYNSGVVFFKKSNEAQKVFDRWKSMVIETEAKWDQHLFSYAFHREQFNPFVLPVNWNYRPQKGIVPVNGPIRILHCKEDEIEDRSRFVDAIQKHNKIAKSGGRKSFSFK